MVKIIELLNELMRFVVYVCTGDNGTYNRSVEIPPDIVMEPIVVPPPDPTAHRMALYNLAKSKLGYDIAATQNELGCAEAVSYLLHTLQVPGFSPTLSTNELYHELLNIKCFAEVKAPLPGDIIISPTGYSTKGSAHGHVGICAFHGIMSNNSMNGLWEQYYTELSWQQYYAGKLGFPVLYFRYV